MEIYFTHPNMLVFLFAIPIVILIHFLSIKSSKSVALRFANFEAISRIKGVDFFSKNLTILLVSSILVSLMIMSLAGLTIKVERQASEFSYIIAIDSSESMGANDFYPNRLAAAKEVASNFVDSSSFGSRIGIVSFSGNALIEQTVTDDKMLIKGAINRINITSIGGTDISETVVTSINALFAEESKSIIIISDGQLNTGSMNYAIDYANRNNVVIHTIGIGTLQGGNTSYGFSRIDENSLKSMAYNTKGTYNLASNNDLLYTYINSIFTFKLKNVPIDLSNYLLIAAIFVFIIEFLLINTKYRIYP